MLVKLKFSVFLLLVICLAGLKASAQDGQPLQSVQEVQDLNQQHPELNLNEDKTLLIEGEGKAAKNQNQSATRDVSSSANNKNKEGVKPIPNDKPEGDPLSFNFIYFIIQKFKISDIVGD